MRTLLTTLLVLTISASCLVAEVPDGFLQKWSDAQKAAQAGGKPIFVHFTTTWCSWCRKIETDTYTDAAAKKALADFVTVSLDCTVPQGEQPKGETSVNVTLLGRLEGEGFPYLVMVTHDGLVLETISGFVPPEELVKKLAGAMETFAEVKKFQEYSASADVKSLDYQVKAMAFYGKVRSREKALAAAEEVLKLDPKNEKGLAVEAKLLMLQAMPVSADNAKTLALAKVIRELDPQNEKGAFEKAYAVQVQRELQAARAGEGGKANFEKAIALCEEINASNAKLSEPVMFHYFSAIANIGLGDLDKAIASAEQALKVTRSKEQAEAIQQFISKIKAAKAQQSQSSAPAK